MRARVRPQPIAAKDIVAKFAGRRFAVLSRTDSFERIGTTLHHHIVELEDESGVREAILAETGHDDVDIFFEGAFQPLGFGGFRLTVVLNGQGEVVNAFFG
jgi:hypothetical protein